MEERRNLQSLNQRLEAYWAATDPEHKPNRSFTRKGQKKPGAGPRRGEHPETLDEFEDRGGRIQIIKNPEWKKPKTVEPIPWEDLF